MWPAVVVAPCLCIARSRHADGVVSHDRGGFTHGGSTAVHLEGTLQQAAADPDKHSCHFGCLSKLVAGSAVRSRRFPWNSVGHATSESAWAKRTHQELPFVTDSNYAANEAGDFAIWDLDQAFARRWTCRVTLQPLAMEQEADVLGELAPESSEQHVGQVVALAAAIREKQKEGGFSPLSRPQIGRGAFIC